MTTVPISSLNMIPYHIPYFESFLYIEIKLSKLFSSFMWNYLRLKLELNEKTEIDEFKRKSVNLSESQLSSKLKIIRTFRDIRNYMDKV